MALHIIFAGRHKKKLVISYLLFCEPGRTNANRPMAQQVTMNFAENIYPSVIKFAKNNNNFNLIQEMLHVGKNT